jgi:mono/diheme cytochrome c family protein
MKTKSLWMTVLASLIALWLVLTLMPRASVAAPPAQDSEPADAAALYKQRCAACHGPNLEGTAFAPAFTHLDHRTDEELFRIVSEGRSGTAMIAWGKQLSTDQIRALVQYLRSPGSTMVKTEMPASQPAVSNVARVVMLELNPRADGIIVARATVRDADAQPVADVPVTFELRTALGGRLEIASAKTDAQGVAVIEYRAGVGRSITLEAVAGESAQTVTTRASTITPGGEAWTLEPLISPGPSLPLIAILATLLGGIWLTYAFIGFQLLGIARKM